ncbi:diguanylate cyclase (GGDEF) domain-containing protein [Burkholderiales bacterium JOSHI_001]|nr:diguanylate cyclase (GGDEF) domain-containing protein [Burkholderiales bacterium JOSHI_001]
MTASLASHIQSLVDQGATEDAVALARQTLEDNPPADDGERAGLLIALSAACVSAGQHRDALRAAVSAGEVYRGLGRPDGQCDALVRLASALRAAGDQGSAITALEEAETLARKLNDEKRRALVLRHIGVCCSLVGRHQHAMSCLYEALDLHQRLGDENELMGTRLSLNNAHNRQAVELPEGSPERLGALEPLLPAWARLAEDASHAGQRRLAVMARGNHAITLLQCGRPGPALAELGALLPRYREYGLKPNEALCLLEMGRCQEALGNAQEALQHYTQAEALLVDGGSLGDLQDAYEGLSRMEEQLGDHRAALAHLRLVRRVEKQKTDEAARVMSAQRELRIELARLSSVWAAQAMTDPLTGLGNRRALARWMSEHLPRAEQGEPLTLLLLDLDHFKRVNDRHGHGVGDLVLQRTAEVIAKNCRERDLAVRYGGEEFVLALASVPHNAAVDIAHRLREAMSLQAWSELTPGLAVSVSIGIAHGNEAGNAEGLLTLADRRLYAAKYAGRDRVVHLD